MMPRQPSVPNFITLMRESPSCISSYCVRSLFVMLRRRSDQVFAAAFVHGADDLRDVLRASSRGDEQRVFRFNDDEAVDAEKRHRLTRRIYIVSAGLDGEEAGCCTIDNVRSVVFAEV